MLAFRCEQCGHLFVPEEKEICAEIDFKDKQIRYVCRNKDCGFENVFDFGGWKRQQKHSPLPTPIIGGY